MNDPLMPLAFTRTLRLKVKAESYPWLNAAAVGMSIFVGSDYERESLVSLASLVNECEKYGLPVMAVTAVGKELAKRDARYLALSCRIAAELGARVVKTYWCENFDKVVNGCPVPVVIAGGPKCETALEVLEFVHDGMQRGAIGLNLGRNVWQHPHPVAMIRAIAPTTEPVLNSVAMDVLVWSPISEPTLVEPVSMGVLPSSMTATLP